MTSAHQNRLSRRERQIMDAVYRLGEATVAEVRRELPDRPTYDAVRVAMSQLEGKGELVHRRDGPRYVYRPSTPLRDARRSALRHLLDTYFPGSPRRAILAVLDLEGSSLAEEDLAELERWIRTARGPEEKEAEAEGGKPEDGEQSEEGGDR